MTISEHVDLTTFSTFMAQAYARYFVVIDSEASFKELITTDVWNTNPRYLLGEGSNTLFVGDYNGLVIKNEIKGLEVVSEDEETTTVRVGGGENWHHLVAWSLDHNLWGIENLVLIPGTVGAAPVQNIGAYGQEAQDTILSVEAIDTETGESIAFDSEACQFSYRNSVFKEHSGKYFITYVTFTLKKNGTPETSYDRVQEELDRLNITEPTPSDMGTTIVTIRDSKLPRVGDLGTGGSFFKNPLVDTKTAQELLIRFPEMKQFEAGEGKMKLSAAWLIEYCGYKGVKEGNVGTYEKHALVLVTYGSAQGKEVWNFAQAIITKVKDTFGVTLEPEVNVIGLS